MIARTGTSDGLAQVVDDLAVDHEVDVEPASHLAGSAQHALLAQAQTLGDRAAAEVVHAGTKLHPVQALALVPASHERLRRPGDEPTPDERLVEPEAELAHVVGPVDHQVAPTGEVLADPDAVPVERAAVIDPRLDIRGLRGDVGGI